VWKSANVVFAVSLFVGIIACPPPQKTSAVDELHAGARDFLAGRYDEAETRFRKAQSLDPAYKYSQLLIARTLHAKYKAGDPSPENMARGHQAVEAYEKFLQAEPASYFAISAVAFLYSRMNQVELQRQWLRKAGDTEGLTKPQRASLYTALASNYWDCAFRFSEQPKHKQTAMEHGKQVTRYVSEGDAAGLNSAKACATGGLDAAEKALALEPDNEAAWSYKAILFREMAKLAEMEGQSKTSFTTQATEAETRAAALSKDQSKQPAPETGIGDSIATGDPLLDEVLRTPYFDLPRLPVPPA